MKCWSCGQVMHLKEDKNHHVFWWCMDCGATTTELPKPYLAVAEETIKHPDGTSTWHIKARETGRKKRK